MDSSIGTTTATGTKEKEFHVGTPKVTQPSKKRARRPINFSCEDAAHQALAILKATEVVRPNCDVLLWEQIRRKRTKDQKDLAYLVAQCCVSKKFVPDTILKDKSDKNEFMDDVAEKIGPLILGNTDGINQTSLPITGDVVEEKGTIRVDVLKDRKLLYVSYVMPTTEVMAVIETYVTQQGARQIFFGSIVGPQAQQTLSRFSIVLLDKKNRIIW